MERRRVQDTGTLRPEEARDLIDELQQQAAQLEEQAGELEALNDELSASEARLRGTIDSALDAVVTTDAHSVILEWNKNAERIFGWPAEEAVGRKLSETIIPPRHREGHERGVAHYLATGEGPILNRRIEITALRKNGTEFPVELTVSTARWGTHIVFISFVRDISERKRSQAHLAAQYAVTRVLAGSRSVEEAVPRILQGICDSLQWPVAGFWEVDEDEDLLRLTHFWVRPDQSLEEFEERSRNLAFERGRGLPGRVWESAQPLWITDVTIDPNFPRHAIASQLGLHTGFAFPVAAGDDVVGVMEFFQAGIAEPDQALLSMMGAIGSDIAQFIKRKHAEERLRERDEAERFLARVSTQLAASTPDYETTLRTLTHMAVPALGDWCSLYLAVGEGETVQRLEIAHADPSKKELARELERYSPSPDRPHPALEVIRTGQPILLSEVPDELADSVAVDERHAELIRSLDLKSVMLIPLRARGRTLGAITLASAESQRRYRERDLATALEFATRAAFSLDNARLFAEAQQANLVKSEFLASMSHELRTPLNAMIGYTSLMEEGIPSPLPEGSLEYVRRVGLSAKHLLQLIEEILIYSRVEAGRETVNIEPVDLVELVDEIRAIVEPLAAEKDLLLEVSFAEQMKVFNTDPRKVRQILVNLLGNAVKFTDSGKIEFLLDRDDEALLLRVRDTGVGIKKEYLERIFDPFWQVQQGKTRVVAGTGLGLSVTRKLVTLLGGTIEVESEPARGTTFTVRLPEAARVQSDRLLM